MKKILIVDDEEDFCFFLKKNLERLGEFDIEVCSDSTQAVEKVKEFKPDALLLDIIMPEVSGSDIAAELKSKEETKNMPIIFLTAIITTEEAEKRSNVIGGEYFLAKPIEAEVLVKVINKVCAQSA